jgi:Zn-dependent metalloprotease
MESLVAARAENPTFAGPGPDQAQLDPESAARRIVEQALASDTLPSFTLPDTPKTDDEIKGLGVEAVPLTGTRVVKFRQYRNKIPVYSSLITVELDEKNELVSLNSSLGDLGKVATVAKISPAQALEVVAEVAGYGKTPPNVPPRLNFYLDEKGKWRLVYIFENVLVKLGHEDAPPGKKAKEKKGEHVGHHHSAPVIFDFVVDAVSGSLVAKLLRTPTVAQRITAPDELGNIRTIEVDGSTSGGLPLVDSTLGIETYDFAFRDPVRQQSALPGALVSNPPQFSSAAVSAHANAAAVATYLRQTLKRNNIDNAGGRMVSSVNCVDKRYEKPSGSRQWFNAFWSPAIRQMVYGQTSFAGSLRSLAASLNVVAHEMFHGVTNDTARLEYQGETGALNESYSDIFGIVISNRDVPSVDGWNWLLGDGLSDTKVALRDFSDPTRFGQPKHMTDYVNTPDDEGGVHTNSGIHNFAAFTLLTSKDGGAPVLSPDDVARIFYLCLTQYLSRQSKFTDSRRGAVLTTRTLFRSGPPADLAKKVHAVEAAFDAAGIS